VPSGTTTPIDDVSMNWWLSGVVQGYLDRQLCHQSNRDAWAKLSSWLKKRRESSKEHIRAKLLPESI
jgi:hypothetical protein